MGVMIHSQVEQSLPPPRDGGRSPLKSSPPPLLPQLPISQIDRLQQPHTDQPTTDHSTRSGHFGALCLGGQGLMWLKIGPLCAVVGGGGGGGYTCSSLDGLLRKSRTLLCIGIVFL